ncbi:hypothetical protein EV356DRAFT_504532 [Viridothelium virens]|uniref:WIBG Mago-binding domain-containing protein n=1 Tax=Viridothelium virens TaxID=1048519 RepID=A0A6A6H559_VIRVR|nr:hypothetical protein EV356DRAFT_504532 [Viridothelium virens]
MPAATGDTTKPATAKSGIQTSTTGESIIPSSTRADGSVRKEIRVRPGYRPPEDIEVYKNRAAEAWKNRGSGGVPGAESLNNGEDKATGQVSAVTNKNARRREARKKAVAAAKAEAGEGEANDGGSSKGIGRNGPQELQINGAVDSSPHPPVDSAAEKEKEARKLSKKLRQAKDLKDKKDKGDSLLPEQFEKVIKMNELIRQLDALGFDAEGERKKNT